MFTAAASRLYRCWRPSGASSTRVAVAVPVKIPAESPDSTRPTKRLGTSPGMRNTALEIAARRRPGRRTARRPIWSESRPKSSSAAATPTAYAAKISVTITPPNPSSCS